MNASLARLLLIAAIILGALGDLLVNAGVQRLGLAIWVLVAAGTAWWVGRRAADRDRGILLVVIALAAIGFVWRDGETLIVFNTMSGLAAAGLIVWRARGRRLTELQLGDGLVAGGASAFAVVTGGPRLATLDAEWGGVGSAAGRRARFLIIGAIAALPLLLITVSLLGEADPIFGAIIDELGRLLSEEFLQHTVAIAGIAWLMAGWLRGGLVADPPVGSMPTVSLPRAPMVALTPALYAMIAILAAFLGLQVRTLFGGAAYVERTTALTYAEYARGGFFELVAVTFLVLVLLLVADTLLDRAEDGSERRFRTAAWVLVALVGVLAASAVNRMSLYVEAYGLSQDRFYALAGMVWIAAALVWFCVSVLGPRRRTFTVGLAAISVVWVLALNLLAPDALVAGVNLGRAQEGKEFDIAYHASLSNDAVPLLVAGAATLPGDQCRDLLAALRARPEAMEAPGWRDWNLPLARAQRSLAPSSPSSSGDYCK